MLQAHSSGPRTLPCLLLGLAMLAAPLAAQEPAQSVAVHCGTLLTGDGKTELHNVWLVVRGGKIASISEEPPADWLPTIDALQKVVMPGLVAVDGDFASNADSEYQVAPDALAIDGFDFDRKWSAALQGGITTAYISPGRQRLVSGQGAVVKLAGTDLVARVLTENANLRMNLGDSALQAPRVFEPVAHPTDADPLLPARIQLPTARISALAEVRALFAAAGDAQAKVAGSGPAQHRYDQSPLADVVAGKLPLRIAAERSQDLRRALQLQAELGVKLVLEDPLEIGPLAAQAAKQGAAATFRLPIRFGQSNPGGEDRLQRQPGPGLDAAAKAAAAGMPIGISPAAGVSPRDALLAAAFAVRLGVPRPQALRAIGADAAAILGVGTRLGSLAPGKDADFVILSGDPLAIGTMVESTWVDGREVYTRKQSSEALAVRCGRILDGEGRTLRQGVILVQDGRIKGVGEDLAIPYGARVIDLPGAVMTPGFLDAHSHLGLAGEGQGVPGGQANQRLHDAIAHDDPMFSPALAHGLTTVLVSGRDGGPVGGRVAAIKTGAHDANSMVVRAIAGQRFQHDAIGPDAIKALRDQLERGKQYTEAWRKYEKELAEWQSGKKPAAAPAPAAAPEPAAGPGDAKPAEDPVSGVWESVIDVQGRLQIKITLDLRLAGTKVTGTIQLSLAGRDTPPRDIEQGSFRDGKLVIEFNGPQGSSKLEATISGDTLTGKFGLGPAGAQDITGKRISKASGGAAAPARRAEAKPDESGKPKAPKVDEALEPVRAAYEQRAALVVRCNRGPAIRDVIELMEKEKLPYVLQGVEDLFDDSALASGNKPAILVGPEVVFEDDSGLRNVAAGFADRDQPILFGSGDCAGSSYLPMHAAYAVRYGLSPADALQALTLWPARAFKLDDRIGSLVKGKDADFVVFSGDPFEPQSRVLLVVCNGRVVVDNREGKSR